MHNALQGINFDDWMTDKKNPFPATDMSEKNAPRSKQVSDETSPDDYDLKQVTASLEKKAIQNTILRKMISQINGASDASSNSLETIDNS